MASSIGCMIEKMDTENRDYCLDLLGEKVVIQTNDSAVQRMLEKCFLICECASTHTDLEIRTNKEDSFIAFHSKNRVIYESVSASELLFRTCIAIEDTICEKFNVKNTRYCALHAGCVCLRGKHIAFLGHKHHGKSSLISYLSLHEDAIYVSDDILFLTNHGVYGATLPIRLRDQYIDGYMICENPLFLQNNGERRFLYTPQRVYRDNPFKIDIFIFPEYTPMFPLMLTKVKQLEGYRMIIDNLKNWNTDKDVFSIIRPYTQEVNMFKLRYNCIQKAVLEISRLCKEN